MKRYDLFGYDADVEERPAGRFVEYEDAARIIAQRDRLAELLQRAKELLPVPFCKAGEGTFMPQQAWRDDVMRCIHSEIKVALAELDKEKS